jgi:hypothetical protein
VVVVLSRHFMEGLRKYMISLSQYSRRSGHISNRYSSEYGSIATSLEPNCSVNIQVDSKLLSEYPFISHGNPDNNLESQCTSENGGYMNESLCFHIYV